jgi:type IV pilus assembly protein PilA
MRNRNKGFSLIELLIVVAIILIIAAIAIPNLLRAQMAANESSAVGSLRTLTTAQATYSSMYNVGYATTYAELGPGANDCNNSNLIDAVLAGGLKSGYTFAPIVSTPNNTAPGILAAIGCADGAATYIVNANPVTCDGTGHRTFYVDQTGVITFNGAAGCPGAGPADAPLQ